MNDLGYTIAVESAVLGGSCCLANGSHIIAEVRGSGGVSRAEDLLLDIASLIRRSEILPADVSKIIVSSGPGSFTGIRIGIATALGFAAALDIVPQKISLFEAMAVVSNTDSPMTVGVPGGRGMAHVARLEISAAAISYSDSPKAVLVGDLAGAENLVVFSDHFVDDAISGGRESVNFLDISPAAALIIASQDTRVRKDVEPILISKV